MRTKSNSNRKNARNNSGPKTANGKRNSSRNAIKHGFFAKELILSDAEKVEVQTVDRGLGEQLLPETALQCIGMEKIVFCYGRCKLAARLETRRLSILLETPQDREVQPKETQDPARMRWYAASRQDLLRAIRFLDDLKQEFERLGRVPEERKDDLDRLFGIGYFEWLTKWPSMGIDAIHLAEHMVAHSKTFRKPLPPVDKEIANTVVDPRPSIRMVGKLIEEKQQHLHDLQHSWERRASESAAAQAASPVDFAPRYFTTASRDLHRAVEWYVYLKKNKL